MKILNYLEEVILFAAFLIMTIIAFGNVVSRNLANISLSFTEEITINLFVLLTFVGTAVGVRRYAHLGFTLIFDHMNPLFKKLLVLFSTLMGLVLFGILLWYGIQMVLFQMDIGQTTPALGWPQWVLSSALPIGAFLCVVRTIQVCVEELSYLSTSGREGDEAK
ncbi:TRAP-type C4-dicarboxylate transport system permease small subunit [Planomicrobium stackebrandtii]|uniref:TRAP-type C4-dicarboxylate transport system permease small subunit n=1 Tax=Planomicrobium stackebrandtii TaxID=253160 RepID=A0ABU0GVP2_9BACL|nr:TRAP transporter small permease [Planomicrobium stackebrandtii]MDQ0429431.1 TRAP-type C4-dicarboxylate transport system permease small subunit [Planomicrobium stackebrandtii]